MSTKWASEQWESEVLAALNFRKPLLAMASILRAPRDLIVLGHKTLLLKLRTPVFTCLEALLPFVVTGFVVGIFYAVSGGPLPASFHLNKAISVPPLVG